MHLIFDVETTGFPNDKLSPEDPNQARIMQLAWILLDDKFEEVGSCSTLIRIPPTVNISEGAQKAHGISREMCDKYGYPIADDCIRPILHYRNIATSVIAHNITFDSQLIDIEEKCIFGTNSYDWSTSKHKCTMRAMTPICKLPHKNGRAFQYGSAYKWPTLQEAYKHCFMREFDKAHSALADVRATVSIYKWLADQKMI